MLTTMIVSGHIAGVAQHFQAAAHERYERTHAARAILDARARNRKVRVQPDTGGGHVKERQVRASAKLGRSEGSRCRQQPMSAMSAGGARTPGGSVGRSGAYLAAVSVCAQVSSPCSRLPYAMRCSSAPNAYIAEACARAQGAC